MNKRNLRGRVVPLNEETRVLGAETFAAITAVEGIKLSQVSQQRIARMRIQRLPLNEQRAEVIRAYLESE